MSCDLLKLGPQSPLQQPGRVGCWLDTRSGCQSNVWLHINLDTRCGCHIQSMATHQTGHAVWVPRPKVWLHIKLDTQSGCHPKVGLHIKLDTRSGYHTPKYGYTSNWTRSLGATPQSRPTHQTGHEVWVLSSKVWPHIKLDTSP